jgi:8-oxo-dGTP diphosphatase
MSDDEQVVRAAGGVVWRTGRSGREIVIVHRPKYGDWSLPKGKLHPGESWEQAALREVSEETGHVVELGQHLGEVEYPARENGDLPPHRKVVRFWVMRSLGGRHAPDSEVDEVRWLPVPDALTALTHAHDRSLVRSFLQLLS